VANSSPTYVCDAVQQNIQKFSNTGTFLTRWSTNGAWSRNNSDPDGICTDGWGNVYTPDYNNQQVYKYSNTGTYECTIGTPGNGPGQCGTLSCGVCVDRNGIVYVADFGDERISEFTTTGTYLCQWGNTGASALGHIDYLSLSPSGTVYVVDGTCVKTFNP
jgi:tripartite motif-containing protein 71